MRYREETTADKELKGRAEAGLYAHARADG